MKSLYIRNFYLSLFFILFALLSNSCTKTSTSTTSSVVVPTLVTTSIIINVTSTSAQSGGVITSMGNAALTANGICYSSANKTPTTADSKISNTIVTNQYSFPPFTSNLVGLSINTTYYIRAYATNSAGTGYGSVVTFTTSASLTAITTTVSTFAGNGTAGYVDASGTGAQLNYPTGVTVDASGNVYVSDTHNSIIREITSAGLVSTFAGTPTLGFVNGAI